MIETKTAEARPLPYRASWVDRFNRWVAGLAQPAWSFFAGLGLLLVLIQLVFLWLSGGWPAAALLPVMVFNGLFTPFLLALIYLLDSQALAALTALRPVLRDEKPDFDHFHYRLANMPALPALAAGLVMLVAAVLMEQFWITPASYAVLDGLPLFSVVFHVTDKSSAFLFGVFIYHTVRQLRMVHDILVHHVRVSLFDMGPLKSFSRLTATTAVGLVVGVYGWVLINPDLLADPGILGFALVITLLALAVFAWPLYGVHRRMVAAKEQALYEIDQRFEALFERFNQQVDRGEHAALAELNGTIASLDVQRSRVLQIPTWPWQSETAQFAVTAIALPLVLAILRFFIELALGI